MNRGAFVKYYNCVPIIADLPVRGFELSQYQHID